MASIVIVIFIYPICRWFCVSVKLWLYAPVVSRSDSPKWSINKNQHQFKFEIHTYKQRSRTTTSDKNERKKERNDCNVFIIIYVTTERCRVFRVMTRSILSISLRRNGVENNGEHSVSVSHSTDSSLTTHFPHLSCAPSRQHQQQCIYIAYRFCSLIFFRLLLFRVCHGQFYLQ